MPTDAALLAEVPFFPLPDDQERGELSEQLDVVSMPAGQVIFNYGEPGDSLYVIRRGSVEMAIVLSVSHGTGSSTLRSSATCAG
jgi:CRP-like cAMP-binding protein